MSIRQTIEYRASVLQPLKTDNTIVDVFEYLPNSVETGPYIAIIPSAGTERYYDSCENEVMHTILIKTINNNIDDTAGAETITIETVDKILDIIRKNDIVEYKDIAIKKAERSWTRGRANAQYKSRICDISVNTFIYYPIK